MLLFQVYSLEQFAGQHAQQAQHCIERLAAFSEAAFDIVQVACRDDLLHLQQHLETFSVRADGSATAAPPTTSNLVLPVSPGTGTSSGTHKSVAELLKSRSSKGRQKSGSGVGSTSGNKLGEGKTPQQVLQECCMAVDSSVACWLSRKAGQKQVDVVSSLLVTLGAAAALCCISAVYSCVAVPRFGLA